MALTRKQMRTFLDELEAGSSHDDAAAAAGARWSALYKRADPESTNYDARFAAQLADAERARIRMLNWRHAEAGSWPAADKLGNTYLPEMQPQAQRLEITGNTQEIVVKHDPSAIVAMLKEVGLVREFDATAPERAEPPALLPARTD